MIPTDDLNILLAWVFFGILLAVLAWLLLRSGQNDALSSTRSPGTTDPAAAPRTGEGPAPEPPAIPRG